jgi:monoamine oxidase
MRDVIVVGGGFAGVTAARECALRERDTLLLEARERLGGRTWSAQWHGSPIEYGGAWVHWHQPHTFSELTRAGLRVIVSDEAAQAAWYVGDERRAGTIAQRDAIAGRGWDRFVDGVVAALPQPHAPLSAPLALERFDRLSIADRIDELSLSDEERDVLTAELESLAHAPLDTAGAVSVLRWHALSGYSLALTQFTGGRVTIDGGTGGLLASIRDGAPFAVHLEAPVARIAAGDDGVEVTGRDGAVHAARVVVVALPVNVLGTLEFDPPLPADKRAAIAAGQASRGIKVMLRVRGDATAINAIRPGHPFGYLASEQVDDDGTQLLIGFGPDAAGRDWSDLAALQRDLDAILPGYELFDATAHDWLADEFSQGTWAIHGPGWYGEHHAAMRRPEGRVLLAGSDIANGWAGFIDGAIESGLTVGAAAAALSG